MRALFLFAAVAAHAAGALTPDPSVVNWSYVYGSHQYPSQTVALTSSTGATSYSAVATSSFNAWLMVNSAYATSSSVLSLGVYLTPAGLIDRLPLGTHTGTVNVTDGNGATAAIIVNLVVTDMASSPTFTIFPGSLAFTSAFGGPAQQATVSITYDGPGVLSATTTSGTTPSWLGFTLSGTKPYFRLGVTVTPAGLSTGRYIETIVLTGSSSIALPVSLTVVQFTTLTATPGVLAFEYSQGGNSPQPQALKISSNFGVGVLFYAVSNVETGGWLIASPVSSVTPAALLITADPTGLAPGFYTGCIVITAASDTLVIPVTLTIRPAPVIAISSTSASFLYRPGDPAPVPLRLQVSGAGASPTFTAAVAGADSDRFSGSSFRWRRRSWLSVSPAAGVAPAILTIAVDPSKLVPGSYNAIVTITGTGSARGTVFVSVSLQVSVAPPSLAKIVNAASYEERGIAPGEITTLFGANLAPAGLTTLALDSGGGVATTLTGVQVLFNGTPAPLVYTTPNQVSAVAPYEIAGGAQTTIQVVSGGLVSNILTLPVVAAIPGIFTANSSGTGPGAILNGDGSFNSAVPAARGDTVVFYVTGEGQTNPPGVTGRVTTAGAVVPLTPVPAQTVTASIAGQAVDIAFAGEAPTFVAGVIQVNVVVPSNINAGTWPLSIAIGGISSPAGVTISVK